MTRLLNVVVVLCGAIVGVPACATIGTFAYAYGDRLLNPPHGCSNIGCWDFLIGTFVGGLVGLFAGPLFAVWLLRRRARRKPAEAIS